MIDTDIDLDFANRDQALADLRYVSATVNKGIVSRHPSGVYFQDVPIDPISGYCSIPYEQATELGYFKVDFLNNSIYERVTDEDHLARLLHTEPDWSLFDEPDIVGMLAHIANHFGIVQSIRPRCIEDLAIVLALIRPGKRYLIGKPRTEIDAEIWGPGHDGYNFKKSHSVAYSVSIVIQLNLLVEEAARQLETINDARESIY